MVSLADVAAGHLGDLTLVPPAGLLSWLPGLAAPAGWVAGSAADAPGRSTRMLIRADAATTGWDGCEVINCYRFTGGLPADFLVANADCTLRSLHADNVRTQGISTPAGLGVDAARSSGSVSAGSALVWAQFSNYVVQSLDRAHGGLIEQQILVKAASRIPLARDITALTDGVLAALVRSLHAA